MFDSGGFFRPAAVFIHEWVGQVFGSASIWQEMCRGLDFLYSHFDGVCKLAWILESWMDCVFLVSTNWLLVVDPEILRFGDMSPARLLSAVCKLAWS